MAPPVYPGFQHHGSSAQCMLISSFIDSYHVGAPPIIITCMGSWIAGYSYVKHNSQMLAVYFGATKNSTEHKSGHVNCTSHVITPFCLLFYVAKLYQSADGRYRSTLKAPCIIRKKDATVKKSCSQQFYG